MNKAQAIMLASAFNSSGCWNCGKKWPCGGKDCHILWEVMRDTEGDSTHCWRPAGCILVWNEKPA